LRHLNVHCLVLACLQGKVRDTYELEDKIVIVTTDRWAAKQQQQQQQYGGQACAAICFVNNSKP
jgi:phosphoribosylaminoimidazole-succinocarboxamide synthase